MTERILRTTREERPPDGGRWTTRSLARTLRVNHMLVHRVWQAEGLLGGADSPATITPERTPWIEVAGVLLDIPSAVVMRVGPDEPANRRPGPRRRASTTISGGHRDAPDVRSALGLLATLDHARETANPRILRGPRRAHDLLVFLRSVEDRSDARSEFHVFFDQPFPESEHRVDAWLVRHRRFHAHYPLAGETWTGTIDRWLTETRRRSDSGERIRVSTSFNEAIARVFAARYPEPNR
jgi:hypothetical protein